MSDLATVTAVTATSYTNAWTLRRACRLLGVELYTSETDPMMPLPTLPKDVEPDWLFFTEEGSLRKALEEPTRAAFLPRAFPPQLFDDKWAFGKWLLEDPACGIPPRQWTIDSHAHCQYPVTLKPRHSWVDDRRLPRGWVCRDAADLSVRLAELDRLACRREWYFLQEWLDETSWNVISTCGFFDAHNPDRTLTCTVERILSYGAGVTGSAVVATIPDAWQLMALTGRILQRLEFVGPFEIEFLVNRDQVIVLELNPRFWMQHGLFVGAGNGLVKRYLERETEADRAHGEIPPTVWIDSVWTLRSLLRLDFRVARLVWQWCVRKGYSFAAYPSFVPALRALVRPAADASRNQSVQNRLTR